MIWNSGFEKKQANMKKKQGLECHVCANPMFF